ncbi:MAG TPA: VWA domain-containing protein [Candidatus Sulfopaludibacter sp.]|jgi:VWFA-related protein|nr:VWA domain-containing protein [Candidatus Sulfopaludibacter sp.]
MKVLSSAVLIAATLATPVWPQQQQSIKTNVDEVLLDMIVRDKKGKPITDLKPDDITVTDNGAKQTLLSFRLVRGSDAVSATGATTPLDPLRQIRLVTLAFEPLAAPDQRKLARSAALDLIKGDQGTNVFYSVVVIDTRLLVLQQFTKNHDALTKAIERATEGLSAPRLSSESENITAELKRNLAGATVNGADQDSNLLTAATQAASQPVTNGDSAIQAKLASVMLTMLRMDSEAQSQGTRLSVFALKALVDGLRQMPGRKSVMYFTSGMYLTPELDTPFRNLISTANRDNVTFYSVDVRGVMTYSQNAGAMGQLNAGGKASNTSTSGDQPVTTDQMRAADTYEVAARANVDMPLRDLAESTGGFLIGESNDLRQPLRHVNEEISAYYEVAYNPGIETYDGSFRKLNVTANRKDLVIHARTGYFALPAEARAAGIAPFEMPLLKLLSEGKLSTDVKFRSGVVLLQPKKGHTDVAVLMEVPLHELGAKAGAAGLDVHCSLAALVKDARGDVVQKITRDRSFHVTAEQHNMGNFLDKSVLELTPGKYTLESAVEDQESSKAGLQKTEFTVPDGSSGVGISSLTPMRSYTPGVKDLTPSEPFQFQGGSVTPTMDTVVKKAPNSALRLFFTVYQDPAVSGKPSVEVEFIQNGKSLTKVPMELPAADPQGRIPYLMTIPAQAIPTGTYEVRATAHQGATSATSSTSISFEQ